jgi:hypothetical protein
MSDKSMLLLFNPCDYTSGYYGVGLRGNSKVCWVVAAIGIVNGTGVTLIFFFMDDRRRKRETTRHDSQNSSSFSPFFAFLWIDEPWEVRSRGLTSLASVGLFFVYFYCLDRRACLTWNLLCFLQVYLFVHWCWCHRLPRVSVWLHRSRDKKHLLLVLRILFWVPIRHHSFSFLKKMPFAMHKMLKKIL